MYTTDINTPSKQTSNNLYNLLIFSAELIESTGSDYLTYQKHLQEIIERLEQKKFHLAVLGQFKRGKSSLLNALLGVEILPTSVIPLTSIPTFIKYGVKPCIEIHFTDSKENIKIVSDSHIELRDIISTYVTEDKNPENRLNVEKVDIYYNSSFLSTGVVLIDTPGIGSTHLHNTRATLNFLPQCDAAIFIVSADPPITETEINFLSEVEKIIDKIFFIINKIDYLSSTEINEVTGFIVNVINEKCGITAPQLFPLSAKQALNACKTNNPLLKKQSKVDLFIEYLEEFIAHDKDAVLYDALVKKAFSILNDVNLQVGMSIKAFKMPIQEALSKLSHFNTKLKEAEKQKLISFDILAGERKRLLQLLEEQAEYLRNKSKEHLKSILDSYFSKNDHIVENEMRDLFSKAIPIFHEHELGEISTFFDSHVNAIINEQLSRANNIINSVRNNAANIFDIPFQSQETTEGLVIAREPYWVLHQWKAILRPIPEEFIDRIVPKKMRERRIRNRLEQQIDILVLNNVENLRWSTLQNINSTFRKLKHDSDEQFTYITDITSKVIAATIEKRNNIESETSNELWQLEEMKIKIEKIILKLKEFQH